MVSNTTIDTALRYGVSAFGSTVALAGNTVLCTTGDFLKDDWDGQTGVLVNNGGNDCGCVGPLGPCSGISGGGAEPPPSVGGLE